MIVDTEELGEMDASEFHVRRLNAKEVLTSIKRRNFIFPVEDGRVKISGEDQDLRTYILIQDSPDRGEEQDNIRWESDKSSSILQQDSSWYAREVNSDFWSILGYFINRHHQVNLYLSTEKSFPLKYIDVVRTIDTTLDVMSEKRIEDYWNVRVQRDLSDAWTSFTRFIVLNEKSLDEFSWIGRESDDNVWPDSVCLIHRNAKKSKNEASRNQSSKMSEVYVIIFFIDPDDEEFKRLMKNYCRKLEMSMSAVM